VPLRKEVAEATEDEPATLLTPIHFFSECCLLFSLESPYKPENMSSESVEDVEAWAQAEGVPSLSDPFIQKYLSGRDALVEQEKKQRSGG
jgi:hypothetical protein